MWDRLPERCQKIYQIELWASDYSVTRRTSTEGGGRGGSPVFIRVIFFSFLPKIYVRKNVRICVRNHNGTKVDDFPSGQTIPKRAQGYLFFSGVSKNPIAKSRWSPVWTLWWLRLHICSALELSIETCRWSHKMNSLLKKLKGGSSKWFWFALSGKSNLFNQFQQLVDKGHLRLRIVSAWNFSRKWISNRLGQWSWDTKNVIPDLLDDFRQHLWVFVF